MKEGLPTAKLCQRFRKRLEAISKLIEAPISKVIVCDTIKLDENKSMDKLDIISVAKVFGASIKRIVEGTSLSSLFKGF